MTTTESYDRAYEHFDYLFECEEQGLISAKTHRTAQLNTFHATFFRLGIPAACTGPNGELQFTWGRGQHHLEVDMQDDGSDWFYRDRETGETWLLEYIGKPTDAQKNELYANLTAFVSYPSTEAA